MAAGDDGDHDSSLQPTQNLQASPHTAKKRKLHAQKFCQDNGLNPEKLEAFADVGSLMDVHTHPLTFPFQLDLDCKLTTLYGQQLVNEAKVEKVNAQDTLNSPTVKVRHPDIIVLSH
jgi:hypothetical protein